MISKILPNQIAAQQTPEQAWLWGKRLIEIHGDNVISEDGHMTRELLNLHLTILEPLSGWPIDGSGWDMTGLNKYAEQLLSGENPSGFRYTYGERLTTYPISDGNYTIDQIDFCIVRLRENPESRRSIAITWVPGWDAFDAEVPCLQLLDFFIRDGKLQCTAFFRSWDVGRAAVPNMYGLARLQSHVAGKVGVPMGSLTIVAASAHIYQD